LLWFWLCIGSLVFFIHVCWPFSIPIFFTKKWLLNANFNYISYIFLVCKNWWTSCKLNGQMFSFKVFYPFSWMQFYGMKLDKFNGWEIAQSSITIHANFYFYGH
jgi:hypothetical protein